jgi:hypothetical protein
MTKHLPIGTICGKFIRHPSRVYSEILIAKIIYLGKERQTPNRTERMATESDRAQLTGFYPKIPETLSAQLDRHYP